MIKYKKLKALLVLAPDTPVVLDNEYIKSIKKELLKFKPYDFFIFFHQLQMRYLREYGLTELFWTLCYKRNKYVYSDIPQDTTDNFKKEYKRYLFYIILNKL